MPGFNVILYPEGDFHDFLEGDSSVGAKLKSLYKNHRNDFDRLVAVIDLLENPETGLQYFKDCCSNQIIKKLSSACSGKGIWEIRTPKTRRTGVMRTYCLFAKIRTIVILDAEFKASTTAGTGIACTRQKEYRRIHGK